MKETPPDFFMLAYEDIQKYGLQTAVIISCLNTGWKFYGRRSGKFYCTLKDIADLTGLAYTTVKKYCPTEETGWRHYSGYKPGTLEKTTWWEFVGTHGEKSYHSERSCGDLSKEEPRGDLSNNIYIDNKRECENGSNEPFTAPSPADFSVGGEVESLAEGGVVKITTPPPEIKNLKKKTDASKSRKARFEFAQELLDRMGATEVKAGAVFCKRIDQLKAQGYDEATLRKVANEAKVRRATDEFFAVPMTAFSESGVQQLLTPKTGTKRKGAAFSDNIEDELERQGYAF